MCPALPRFTKHADIKELSSCVESLPAIILHAVICLETGQYFTLELKGWYLIETYNCSV